MNSKNIFDTFRCIFQLRRITTASIFLFLIWSLSPLGGQASLRELYKENATATDPIPLRYLDTGPLGQMYTATWSGAGITQGLGVVLDAALYQDYQTKAGPQDAWGNLKIPRLEGFANSTKNPEGWYEICEPPCPKIRDVETYTSLIGFPVVGIPSTDRTQFSLETSYVSLECSKFHAITESEDWSESVLNITCPDWFDVYGLNQTQSSIARLAEFLAVPGNEPESTIQPTDFTQTLIVQGWQNFNKSKGLEGMQAFCKAFRTSGETAFDCYFGECSAVRTRPSETDHRGKNLTIFDFWGRHVLEYVMSFSHTEIWGIPLTIELFMKNPATQPVIPLNSPGIWGDFDTNSLTSAVNFTKFTQDEFATRLALLLNTITQIFLTLGLLEADLPSDLSLYGPDHTLVGGSYYLKGLKIGELASLGGTSYGRALLQNISRIVGSPRFVGASANATHVAYREVYKPNIAWVVILLLASGVLVGLGFVGIWRSRDLRAPDIFDPVMAFTYGNKYIDVPEYGSTLDAKRRARLLPNVEVRLGDVDGHWGVGKVALGMAQDVHLLKKDRLYE